MKNLVKITIGLLVGLGGLLTIRAVFFAGYAPEWFWSVLTVNLGLTGLILIYCTLIRGKRLRSLKSLKSQPRRLTLSGSIIFHLGLALIIGAGFYYSLFQYKAVTVITEGQTVIDSQQNQMIISQGPILAGDFDQASFTLRQVNPDFYNANLVEHLTADLVIEDLTTGKARQVTAAVNRPFGYKSREATVHKFGFAPLVSISSLDGEVLWQGYVNLDLVGGKADLFLWPLSGERVTVTPVLTGVTVEGFKLAGGDQEVTLLLNGASQQFLGYAVQIPEYRYWLSLVITSTNGKVLINIGLLVLVLGIMIRYIFVFKDRDNHGAC